MLFGIKVNNNKESFFFFEDTARRLQGTDPLKTPYSIKRLVNPLPGLYLLYLKPIYPDVALYGNIFIFAGLLFGAPLWITGFSILFIVLRLGHTNYYNYLLLKIGLYKAGYRGKTKYLGCKEMMTISILEGLDLGTN